MSVMQDGDFILMKRNTQLKIQNSVFVNAKPAGIYQS